LGCRRVSTTLHDSALRRAPHLYAALRIATQLNAPFCIPKQSYCFGIPKGINCRPAAPRYAQRLITPLRTATQRSDFPAASAPGWPGTIQPRFAARCFTALRITAQRSATQRTFLYPQAILLFWDTEGYQLRVSTLRGATPRNSTLRLSRRFGAGMAGKPFNHASPLDAPLLDSPQCHATQRIKRKDK